MPYREIDPPMARAALQQDPSLRVLDVRTDHEYRMYRLPGSVLVPVQEIAERFQELDASANWLVVCERGGRSAMACEFLAQAGFKQVTNLAGGMANWLASGLPVDR